MGGQESNRSLSILSVSCVGQRYQWSAVTYRYLPPPLPIFTQKSLHRREIEIIYSCTVDKNTRTLINWIEPNPSPISQSLSLIPRRPLPALAPPAPSPPPPPLPGVTADDLFLQGHKSSLLCWATRGQRGCLLRGLPQEIPQHSLQRCRLP